MKTNRYTLISYILAIGLIVFPYIAYSFCLNPLNFLKKDINIGSGTQNKKTTISAVSESSITVNALENAKILENSNVKIDKAVQVDTVSVAGMVNSTISANVNTDVVGLQKDAIKGIVSGISIKDSKFNVSSNTVIVENTINIPAKFFTGSIAGIVLASILWIIIILIIIKRSKK